MRAKSPYSYRRKLPHLQKERRPIFVTFTTDFRRKLTPAQRQIVLDCCLSGAGKLYDLHVAVVMPDHVHLLLTACSKSDDETWSIPEIMQVIKGRSARQINRQLGRRGKFWQEESFDHVPRTSDKIADAVDYLVENPVRAGLVSKRKITRGRGWAKCLPSAPSPHGLNSPCLHACHLAHGKAPGRLCSAGVPYNRCLPL